MDTYHIGTAVGKSATVQLIDTFYTTEFFIDNLIVAKNRYNSYSEAVQDAQGFALNTETVYNNRYGQQFLTE